MESKVQIMAVSETKIDASYTDSQFHIPGYHLHHPDRKKGSGRVLMLGTSKMESVRVKIDRRYKKIEIIALQFVLKTKTHTTRHLQATKESYHTLPATSGRGIK